MRLVKPGLMYRLEVGPEFLYMGELPSSKQQAVGFGRVDGELMPQYTGLYDLSDDRSSSKWQVVNLNDGRTVVLALVTQSQIGKKTRAMAILYADRSKYLFSVHTVPNGGSSPLKKTLVDPLVQVSLTQLKPVDPQQFQASLRTASPQTISSTIGVLEQMVGSNAKGWALNTLALDKPVDVLIRNAEGELVGFGEASFVRPDLAMLGVCQTPAGFLISVSPRVLDGTLQRFYAIDESTEELIQLTPIVCSFVANESLSHVLMDLPSTLEQLDKHCPKCDPDLRLLLEKLCVLIELSKVEAQFYLAGFVVADPGMCWLLEVKRAELALLAGHVKRALAILDTAEEAYPHHLDALKACKNLIRLNTSNLSAI